MGRRKKETHLDCIAYLSCDKGSLYEIEKQESAQLRIIREYAKAHNIKVVKVIRRNGFSMRDVYRHFNMMASMIGKRQVDGVILFKTRALTDDEEIAYDLIGKIKKSKGAFVTTAEGRLGLDLKEMDR